MVGRNLFGLGKLERQKRNGRRCVFISHSKKDKSYARLVAQTLQNLSLDIYFDEHDDMLRKAAHLGDHHAIVSCIEDGLDHSTHLLGLITQNTKDSWWVPYEIGGASARKRNCAYLIAPELKGVPSYIRIRQLLLNWGDLSHWVNSIIGTRKREILNKRRRIGLCEDVVPTLRKLDELELYEVGL